MLIGSLFKKIQILKKEFGTRSLDLKQKFLYFLLKNKALINIHKGKIKIINKNELFKLL
ncbi:hypothetical protein [Campylobacter sp. MIT 97-5078]|uniref:hypothetical protein n=1 Tax=Campylobacter sp. MIT 97-5078 TaxID=1548153 RepID=UPI000AAD34C0|nr:hypothetical protein [Campylobacter sp. MIT 97-5078]